MVNTTDMTEDQKEFEAMQSLRDTIAIAAMQSVINTSAGLNLGMTNVDYLQSVAKTSYQIADAMLEYRNKEQS